eukprot:4604272-Pleurochrysis_carterae.AAC.7
MQSLARARMLPRATARMPTTSKRYDTRVISLQRRAPAAAQGAATVCTCVCARARACVLVSIAGALQVGERAAAAEPHDVQGRAADLYGRHARRVAARGARGGMGRA